MEVRNSEAESHSSDQSQPIQETEGDEGSKVVAGGMVDVDEGGGVEVEIGNGGEGAELVKKKRGRPPRAQAKSPPIKIIKEEDEDVCFICFDGGSLVLCDRRGCPKAYHPACVKRDEAFFQSKAKWNCGWHICSICQKSAHHMCYTCTYSLCKGCIKKADYVCVRGDKGFCIVCMKTIMLIENNGQGKDEKGQVDFDDKTSWEYLFKVYWLYLKRKLSLTLDELTEATNPWKVVSTSTITSTSTTTPPSVTPSTCIQNGDKNDDMSPQNIETIESKKRKTDEPVITKKPNEIKEWATKDLLDFVSHMKNGDTSLLSQFDVQELMLEYIKRNNLRDPRKKSQIICDSRLKILFGKPRVGHFEMLKLLEFHFFINEDLPKNTIKNIGRQVDPDWNIENMVALGRDNNNKKRKNHKKGEERVVPQNKVDEYAAIDVHNMNLIYLRRKLMENLIGSGEDFRVKAVGSIVRIRISGSDQKHDMYRLVQVVGTSKAEAPYKIGDKSVDIMLEVLNLDKKETVSVNTISNQDLSEDECRRLRQSVRCGLVKRFTVGDIQDKAVSLQSARLNDLMEAETLRLNNLRDRAKYVEKLQLLKTPEERERRLREIPEVHSDPKMNPDYETDDNEEYSNKEHVQHIKSKHSGIDRKTTNSPKKQPEFSNNVTSSPLKNNKPHRHLTIKPEETPTKSKDSHGSTTSVRPQTHIDSTHQTTATSASSPIDNDMDKVWHYRDPSGKIQGPFCKIQLQKWSTTGYFPVDMRIWMKKEDESILLNDVITSESESPIPVEKSGTGIERLTVRISNPKSTENNHVSSVFDASDVELPSPTPKTRNEDEKVSGIGIAINVGQDGRNRNLNGGKVEEWSGYSPTSGDHGGLPPVQGVCETIEFSTLAEESVSDLLAEVDAMESQNGFPSPTSTRNNFGDDLFNGYFEEFSPTPKTGPDIHFPFHSTTTTTTTTAAATTATTEQITSKNTIDVNNSTKIEANEIQRPSPSPPPPPLPPPVLQPPPLPSPPPPQPQPRPVQEMAPRVNPYLNMGWGPQQRMFRPGEIIYNGKPPPWGRQAAFGGGSGGGNGGGYQRTPPKGKRVCKFYESGRCNKGASCNYWHP
ncbi:hypothetical protein LXL04_007241 [Taraxacum kok-saghyz]